MAKNDKNLKSAENFVRELLAKHFNQKIDQDRLERAAERLCEAIPEPVSA